MYNCCVACRGLRVWKDGSQAGAAAVVGSREWVLMKEQQEQQMKQHQQGAVKSIVQQEEDNTVEVGATVLTVSWSAHLDIGETTVSHNAGLPRHSVVGSSVHVGEGPLFAICCIPTLVASTVYCSGVSWLPPGSLWLELALLCGGLDPNKYVPGQMHLSSSEDRSVLDDMGDRIDYVADALVNPSPSVPMCYDVNMVDCLRLLFTQWTSLEGGTLLVATGSECKELSEGGRAEAGGGDEKKAEGELSRYIGR